MTMVENKDLYTRTYWEDGYWCRVRQTSMGTWCGYVALTPRHPWFNQDYDEIPVDIHGGLTYSKSEPDGYYWIGFDCAHWGDYIPMLAELQKQLEKEEVMTPAGEMVRLTAGIEGRRWTKEETAEEVSRLREQVQKREAQGNDE